ncbi:MAG TPA: L-seryl-tRNA(Sec) selenium transferase [Paenibacillaceae bacterium]|nr:L-seryl-tRNA(Sec) selenium transferase [Paenibacillaceae bacterium]
MEVNKQGLLRSLPAVHKLINTPEMILWKNQQGYGDKDILPFVQQIIERERKSILQSQTTCSLQEVESIGYWIDKLAQEMDNLYQYHLRRMINATGVILHTNLGRAVLSEKAIKHVIDTAASYSNLEYKIHEGERGSRHTHVERLLTRITGAEAGMIVNNNAAAVFLVLREMARNKEVIVSRGQLVEIGGSFRISEIMEESGANLKEVGTTNKTHPRDYEKGICQETALLMKVHTSNFRVMGFTRETTLRELVELGKQYGVPVYEDLGSGVLFDLSLYGIGNEPVVGKAIEEGADLVSFSGDKLLGGPQAGIIVGKKEYIDRLKRNQLARVLRVDKMTLAALESTLLSYVNPERAKEEIPVIRDLLFPLEEVRRKTEYVFYSLRDEYVSDYEINMGKDVGEVGGGTLPGVIIPTWVLSLRPRTASTASLERKLRYASTPIIGRIQDEKLILDFRTVNEEELTEVVSILKEVM